MSISCDTMMALYVPVRWHYLNRNELPNKCIYADVCVHFHSSIFSCVHSLKCMLTMLIIHMLLKWQHMASLGHDVLSITDMPVLHTSTSVFIHFGVKLHGFFFKPIYHAILYNNDEARHQKTKICVQSAKTWILDLVLICWHKSQGTAKSAILSKFVLVMLVSGRCKDFVFDTTMTICVMEFTKESCHYFI